MSYPVSVYVLLRWVEKHGDRLPEPEVPKYLRKALDVCLGDKRPLLKRRPVVRMGPEESTTPTTIGRTPQGKAAQALYELQPAANEPDTETLPDSSAFVPVGKLWPNHFDTYSKAKKFLANHPEIKTNKPSSNRLEVHAGDWIKYWTKQQSDPTDDQIDAYLEGVEQREREVRRE